MTTWQAVYSMFGPYAIGNLIMLVAIIVAVVFQPKFGDPNSFWVAAIEAGLLLVAGIFVVKGTLRLRQVRKSAREDKRRISAGLPLEPEDPEDTRASVAADSTGGDWWRVERGVRSWKNFQSAP